MQFQRSQRPHDHCANHPGRDHAGDNGSDEHCSGRFQLKRLTDQLKSERFANAAGTAWSGQLHQYAGGGALSTGRRRCQSWRHYRDLHQPLGVSCYLSGYPGVAALDRTGRQFTQATRTLSGYLAGCGCTMPARIRLLAGASASSTVEGDNGGGNECLQGHALLVTPPNTTAPSRLAYLDAYTCRLQVHPVVTGITGQQR